MITTDVLRISMLASPASAGLARTLTAQRLCKWDCFHISDDALLVVTELIANAAEATPRQPIQFEARRDAGGLLIAVWDSSPRLPVLAPPVELTLDTLDLSEDTLDTNGGRGLHLVAALSADWGHRLGATDARTGHPYGKWVWSRLRC